MSIYKYKVGDLLVRRDKNDKMFQFLLILGVNIDSKIMTEHALYALVKSGSALKSVVTYTRSNAWLREFEVL